MRTVFAIIFAAVGCSTSHDPGTDGGPLRDSPSGTMDAVAPLDAPVPDGFMRSDRFGPPADGGIEPEPGTVICGGVECAAGWACCTLTLECFDPADASACEVPPEETDPDACASNAECDPGELCEASDIFHDPIPVVGCGAGVGRCVAMRGPELCGGFGPGVCGCDGRTYRDPCAASRAGVRVAWLVPCGTPIYGGGTHMCEPGSICPGDMRCDLDRGVCVDDDATFACGIDAQCRSGEYCCGAVGACMPTSCPECCFAPPRGTTFPCSSNDDCGALEEPSHSPGDYYYCAGEGCGTRGGCTTPEGSCSGVLDPVCGCDGTSYTNACWASQARTRVAHAGECP